MIDIGCWSELQNYIGCPSDVLIDIRCRWIDLDDKAVCRLNSFERTT